MARSRGHGDERAERAPIGQQTGSKRPRREGGTDTDAPKKGGIPPKGTARPGASMKAAPSKGGRFERSGGKP
jgi:hypothetical protein